MGTCAAHVWSQTESTQPETSSVDEAAPAPSATGDGDAAAQELGELDLGELGADVDLLFQDFDIVVTAGRVAQPVTRASAPVSVLTSEDIHYSGVTSVPLILEFVPGVDVLQADRNRFAIGVRGLHHEFSDRTLVLLDGRNASSPVFGGVDFFRLPTFMEDLDRIEVVRGPGGAVWGANAFNGVVNLISKDPRETEGVLLSSTLNHFGDTYNHARFGFGSGRLAARISLGYDEQESSEDAIAGDDFTSTDFSRSRRLALDGVYELDEDTDLSFGFGHTHTERGDFEFALYQPFADERLDYNRGYVKLSHEFSENVRGYFQWYGTYEDINRPTLWRYDSFDNTFDGQLDFAAGDSHDLTVGATARLVSFDVDRETLEMALPTASHDEQWAGVFVSDRWRARDRLTIETQLRADWYSGTTLDWSGRLSALIDLDRDGQHVLRLSGAKAFRAPQASLRELDLRRQALPSPPFPADTYGVRIEPAGDLDNEQIWSLEAGYTGRIADGVTMGVNTYLQRYTDLTGVRVLDDPLGLGRGLYEIDNLGGASAAGIEPEITVSGERGRLTAWYALNEFDYSEDPAQNARAFVPSEHKIGLRGRIEVSERVTASANYRYTSPIAEDALGTEAVPEHHRLDLTLAADVFDQKGEIMIGVLDVFDETALSIETVGGAEEPFETPGRTLFARLQLRF